MIKYIGNKSKSKSRNVILPVTPASGRFFDCVSAVIGCAVCIILRIATA